MNDSQEIIPENIVEIKNIKNTKKQYYYCINDLLYKGNKSEIYKGRDNLVSKISSSNSYDISFTLCIKKELPFLKYPELETEHNILNHLQKFLNKNEEGTIPCSFVPKLHDYFHNDDSPSYLIEELYGNSLNSIFKMCKYKFSLLSSIILIEKMFSIIQSLHETGIIHRNLNPHKFLFGKEETSDKLSSKMNQKEIKVDPKSQLYLIDYSSAKFYKNDDDIDKFKHIRFVDKVKDFYFTNKNFCSIWAELKMEQSRRDDLYSLFYIMIYLFIGKLPWMNIKCKSKNERREKIKNLKLCLSNFELCQNINKLISNEVELFAFYLNGLSFDDEPNYNYLKQLIEEMQRKVINSRNIKYTEEMITIIN